MERISSGSILLIVVALLIGMVATAISATGWLVVAGLLMVGAVFSGLPTGTAPEKRR